MDNHKPPPLPHATTTGPSRGTPTTNHHALENLKSLLMKCAIASTPAKSLTLPQKTFIEKRIQDFLPTIHTPDHPPYAWMIENAIKQLNEEEGSTEEAISLFILEEYKDLPWAHAALLKHHLRKLSESGNLVESHDGCYLIRKASITHSRTSKPSLRFACTTSRSPSPNPSPSSSPSPSPSPSPSLSPSSSSSPTYASSSTSSSSQSFSLKGKGRKKKRNYKRKRSQRWEQNARGIKIHPKYKGGRGRGRGHGRGRGRGSCRGRGRDRGRGRGRVRGRGRGRGRDWSYGDPCEENLIKEVYVGQVEDEVCVHHMEAIEIQYLMIEDEAADENIQGKEQPQELGSQEYVDVESQAQQSVVIEIEPPEHEYRVNEERIEPLQQDTGDNCSTPSTIPWSHGRKLIGQQGSKKDRQQNRNIHSRHTPQTGTGQGRPRKIDMQMRETGKNMEPLEATEIGALKVEDKQKTEEQSQQKEDQCYHCRIEVCLMNNDNMANMMEGEIQYVDQVEQEEGDTLDELIEEVYMELKEATETQYLTIDDEAAEGNLQRKEHHQVQGNHGSVNVECQAEPSTMVIETGPQQEHIVSEETIETEHQNVVGGDNSSRPSTTPWSHRSKLISEQGQEQGSRKVRLWKRSIQHTPQTTRGRGRPHKRDMQMEVTGKIMEPPEVTQIGDLMAENEQETGERSLSREGQSGWIEIQDHTEGMQNRINQQVKVDQTYKINDVEPQEQECTFTDNLNELQPQESAEEQNHAQIHVQGYKGATEGRIQLEEDNGEGAKGQSHTAQIQDEINKKSLIDQISKRSNVNLHEREYHVDDNLDEQQLEDNECSGNPTVREVTEKQCQPQTWQAELTLVLSEPRTQESNGNEQQDQLKGGQMKMMGQNNICLGDCVWIEEENHVKKAFEVLEERNQQIDHPEVITEKNQSEDLHCFLVDTSGKDNEEFEHCDELKKLENENNEEQYPSGKTQADANPHEQHNEDKKQQFEQPKKLFLEPVEIAEHDQPIKESERMRTENVGAIVEGNEMSQHLKQTLLEPQCRQLRPHSSKSLPDQTEQRLDLPSPEKSSETNQRRKLRPRPSRNESTDVANRSELFAAMPELRKRQELGARRSLRP